MDQIDILSMMCTTGGFRTFALFDLAGDTDIFWTLFPLYQPLDAPHVPAGFTCIEGGGAILER